jgi:hypothetical protein
VNKTDITMYGDGELSLIVMNDESLYRDIQFAARRENWGGFRNIIEEYFIFTPEQLDDLKETFDAEVEEYNREDE